MTFDVFGRCAEQNRVIVKRADTPVAVAAQPVPQFTGLVIVISMQIARTGRWVSADSTLLEPPSEPFLVLLPGDLDTALAHVGA
jgi:hypothetical protein